MKKFKITIVALFFVVNTFGQKPYVNWFIRDIPFKKSVYNNNIKCIYELAKASINYYSYNDDFTDTIVSHGFSFDDMSCFLSDSNNEKHMIFKNNDIIKKISTYSDDFRSFKNIDYYFCYDSDSSSVYIAYIYVDSLRMQGFYAHGFFYYDKCMGLNFFFSLNEYEDNIMDKKFVIPNYSSTDNINCLFVLYANFPTYRYNWFRNEIESISRVIFEDGYIYENIKIYSRCSRKGEFLLDEIALNDLMDYHGVERFSLFLKPDINYEFLTRPYWLFSYGYKNQ